MVLNKYYLEKSIKWKIILIIFIVCIPSIIIGLSFVSYFHIKQTHTELNHSLQTTTDITADHLSASVAFKDNKNAYKILGAFKREGSIETACVYDSDNNLFASFEKNTLSEKYKCQPTYYSTSQKDDLHVFKSKIQEGSLKNLGVLEVHASFEKISSLMRIKLLLVSISLIIILGFFSYPLASLLQKSISNPINELLQTSKSISQISDAKIQSFQTSDEVLISIKIMEDIKTLSETYFESIEATESALVNHKQFLDVIDEKIQNRNVIHQSIVKELDNTPYDNILEIAEHTLSLQSILNLETEELLSLLHQLYEDQATILKRGNRVLTVGKDAQALIQENLATVKDKNTQIILKEMDENWLTRVYESAFIKMSQAVFELFEGLRLHDLEYTITIEPTLSNYSGICFSLEYVSDSQQQPFFDYDNVAIDKSLFKIKHYTNINNPNKNALKLNTFNHKVELIIHL